MVVRLDTLDDDTLIYIFVFLDVPEILAVRQTCWRIYRLSSTRIIWKNVCINHVLRKRYPFPSFPSIDAMDAPELERRTRHAYRLATKWQSTCFDPAKMVTFEATSAFPLADLRFLPGRDGKRLLTISKGVWSMITVWDIGDGLRRILDWSPSQGQLNEFALNTDPNSPATMAVSIFEESRPRIEILSLRCDDAISNPGFETLSTIDTPYKPMSMSGDIIAFSDDIAETMIWNWRDSTYATLRHLQDIGGIWQRDQCLKVLFVHKSILVVRARSIHLFPEPNLGSSDAPTPRYGPVARHSFGWINGISVSENIDEAGQSPLYNSLSILVRSERNDPLVSDVQRMDLYVLEPNPAFSPSLTGEPPDIPPYIFPPTPSLRMLSAGGSLRCTDVILGRHGTAVWLHPRDRARGLVVDNAHLQDIPMPEVHETLVAAVLPGPLKHSGVVVEWRSVWKNAFNDWTCLDYDEELGRIALGSNYGRVIILDL